MNAFFIQRGLGLRVYGPSFSALGLRVWGFNLGSSGLRVVGFKAAGLTLAPSRFLEGVPHSRGLHSLTPEHTLHYGGTRVLPQTARSVAENTFACININHSRNVHGAVAQANMGLWRKDDVRPKICTTKAGVRFGNPVHLASQRTGPKPDLWQEGDCRRTCSQRHHRSRVPAESTVAGRTSRLHPLCNV